MNSIAFNADMVRAILDGSKTHTRRIGKKGEVGDVLWVQEPWAKNIPGCPDGISYRADHITDSDGPSRIEWQQPKTMPREFSRLSIRITAVRQERLQEISEDDAIREGATGDIPSIDTRYPKTHFAHLWDSINGDKTGLAWADNPLVWVHEFDVADALKLEGDGSDMP